MLQQKWLSSNSRQPTEGQPTLRQVISAALIVCLLTPTAGAPQPQAATPPLPPRPQGLSGALPQHDPCGQIIPSSAGVVQRIFPGPDYRLGAGDLLDIVIAGRLDVSRHQVTVNPEGAINVPPIGTVEFAGLSLVDAQRRLAEQARQLFKFVEVSLALLAPRCVEVTISGEVERPGTLQISAIRRVHEVIQLAGGASPRGSVRRVLVAHDATARELDILRFELLGHLAQNPVVQQGMRIHVPPIGATVTLAGAVRRPGEYELGPTGSLRQLLELTGGLAQAAARGEARLTRVGAEGRRETISVDLATAVAPPADVVLQPGDRLFVPSLGVLQDVVEVRGAFNGTPESGRTEIAGKPAIVQRFELAQGDRVRDVVVKAGGPAPFADLRLALIERGGIAGPRQRIPLDLHRLLVEKDETQNVLLENGDALVLPVVEDKVYVVGEVKNPGAQDFRPGLTPREYLALAGGPTVRARFRNATVTFRNGRSYALGEAPPLEPGAVVTVPEVAVRWYQDYLVIAQAIAGLAVAATGLFFIFDRGTD